MAPGIDAISGHHFYAPLLGADSVVVDLGACEASFANAISTRWGARVFAVEANPANFAEMQVTARVSKHHAGIADHTGHATLYVAPNRDGHSLDPRHRDVGSLAAIEIPTTTLFDFMQAQGIAHIDLLKVDIEGAEVALFESLPDQALRCIDQVTVEFHDFIESLAITGAVRAIKRRMTRLGFWTLVYARPNVDVLFVNKRAVRHGAWRLHAHHAALALSNRWLTARHAAGRVIRSRRAADI